MTTTYNINSEVEVILTEYGAKILTEYWKEFQKTAHIKRTFKEGDTYNIELWHLMSIFGDHLYNGGENAFKDNLITITIPR